MRYYEYNMPLTSLPALTAQRSHRPRQMWCGCFAGLGRRYLVETMLISQTEARTESRCSACAYVSKKMSSEILLILLWVPQIRSRKQSQCSYATNYYTLTIILYLTRIRTVYWDWLGNRMRLLVQFHLSAGWYPGKAAGDSEGHRMLLILELGSNWNVDIWRDLKKI